MLISFVLSSVLAMVLGLSTFMTTIPPAKGVTLNEMLTFIECTDPFSLSSQESYSCDRIALYMKGECGVGGSEKDPSRCNTVAEYIIDEKLYEKFWNDFGMFL